MIDFNFNRNKENYLQIQNLEIIDLIKKYGSPLFLYDGNNIEKEYVKLDKIVKSIDGQIHYAVKANDNLGILKLLSKLNCGSDVVSIGELKKSIKAGINNKHIIFSGVGKSNFEIEEAIKIGIKQLNVESLDELDDVIEITNKLQKTVSIALRVNLNIKSNTHKKISTGDDNTKFGVNISEIEIAYKKMSKNKFLKPVGLAVHIGSQIFDYSLFHNTYSELKTLASKLIDKGFEVPTLDLGGGFGVKYNSFQSENFQELKKILINLFKKSTFKISLEPGRSLVANSGLLITKVIRKKQTTLKNFLIVDAAMNNFIRPTLYDAYHQIEPLFKDENRKKIKYDIVGPICETGDYLGNERDLQECFKGDFLAIMSVGAYGSVMRSNYNSRPDISEVLIYKGKDYLLRNRQTLDDLLKKDLIPNF